MGLLEKAKQDIERITSNLDGFAAVITLTAPDDSTVTVNGLHSKHHLGIDPEGNRVNTKNAHISISEKFLTDASYPVRNASGQVHLKKHRVSVKDSTGEVCEYVITEFFPNETIGLITCILGDYSS